MKRYSADYRCAATKQQNKNTSVCFLIKKHMALKNVTVYRLATVTQSAILLKIGQVDYANRESPRTK